MDGRMGGIDGGMTVFQNNDPKALLFILAGLISGLIGGFLAQKAKKSGKMPPFIASLVFAALCAVCVMLAVLVMILEKS